MSEIEKMYENAKITLKKCSECDNNMDCGFGKDCYPPFTAEKQIELIKWLIKEVYTLQMWHFSHKHDCYDFDLGSRNSTAETFEECIAKLVNNLWQNLTEEEKQQVKGILE